MKKIILTKTIVQKPRAETSCPTLFDRKSMLPHYKKLFEILFDFPDKKVASRVLDAINNTKEQTPIVEQKQECPKCLQRTPKVTTIAASTQTECELSVSNFNAGYIRDTAPTTSMDMKTQIVDKQSNKVEPKHEDGVKQIPAKRKRRRKIKIPQVIKRSQAQQQQDRNKPLLQKRNISELKLNDVNEDEKRNSANGKRLRQDSVSSAIFSDNMEDHILKEIVTPEEIRYQMADEILKAECIQEDGLWPIHSAIVNNDSKQLIRQILVWKLYKKEDLNEILTDDNEDCLQLALVEKSSESIVNILLSYGLNVDSRDVNSNTILHLAVLNEVSTDIFCLLMEKVDLETVFVLNYDGYTPLHLAIRQNEYMLAEALLDNFDKRLLGEAHYDRTRNRDEKHFLNYYEQFCQRFKLQLYLRKYDKKHFEKKRKLLDIADVRSGKTCLLYAVENKFEHLIYFLLAHLSNPGAQNFSGQSPSSFMNEFAKSLNLSLRIDEAMENVSFLINK